MAYELVTLGLVTVLISPVSWRHHYLLTLIPVIYLWVRLGERWRYIAVLSAATLAMGTVFPDYVIVTSSNPVFDLALSGVILITSSLLLFVLCRNYEDLGVIEC